MERKFRWLLTAIRFINKSGWHAKSSEGNLGLLLKGNHDDEPEHPDTS